ncbi:hybrid sensor histidine kinase/response regulator transcription factor [Deminuibacter soli]|uniref:histidine kinase n=1 Tax=Deminuibacter soli TaxID=2291815 RepID=A0A3E1NG24_9BACT|nr:substrate-binding domain-containing protein [Deminuibacter soli]RFM26774.1 response regulator [Deminuibacter soli]
MIYYCKRNCLLACIAFLLIALCSCSKGTTHRKYKIAFSQCTDDNYRRQMLADIKRELAFHPDVELLYRDASDSSQLQVEQVKQMMKQDIDLLIISPNEAQPLTGVVEEVFNKGIPVIVIDRTIASQLYTSFIGADNFELGKMAGDYAADLLHHKGNIVEVIGRPGSTPAIGRQNGFRQSIDKYPGIHITREVYGYWLKDKATTALTGIKNELLQADLIYAHNDVMALGAYNMCKELGIEKRVKIIGVDGTAVPGGGLDLVNNKIINATMFYPTGGKEAVQTAFKILNGEMFDKQHTLQTLVIDSTNVHLMQLQSAKIDEQQKDIEKQQSLLQEQRNIYRGQQTFLYITIAALILSSFLSAVVLVAWRSKRRINKRLAASNEEISRQRNQLIEMTARAGEATEAKFNFFTNISHELRTPLTLIFGPLENVMANPKLHFSLKSDLDMINKNALRLLRLVNQLMDFRKIEHQKMKLRATENDLVHFVEEITYSFKENARKKNITLQVNTRMPNLMVWFDANMLDKVLFNLLSNALKFTRENGYITVSINKSPSGREAVVVVEDTGIGMTPATAKHAFDLFYQEGGSSFKGTGLGLSLSKELIELHRGKIVLESEKWKGTRFEILLPLGAAHLQEDELVHEPVSERGVYEEMKIYTAEQQLPAYHAEDIAGEAKEYSILIIEDSDDLRNFLKQRLSLNFTIFEAGDGNSGLAMAYEVIPDLIICDILMPEKDGLSITQTLKTDIRSSHIPVIILTASNSMEKQIASLKLNADAFISKPFNLQHLEETIKSLLKSRKMLQEHYTSDGTGSARSASAKVDRKFLNEFTAIVEKNIGNECFSAEEICREISISRIQLNRKVKALLGINVNDYILNVRLQRARYLLSNEDLSISEVASKVGFSSQAYFSTVFKSKLQVTPSEYKEKTKG